MTWVRLSVLAARDGISKKTALRRARRSGFASERRPVRGGWAWFVNTQEKEASGVDVARLERCISLALKLDGSVNGTARLAAKLYEVM